MTECHEIKTRLGGLLDGELDADARQAVAWHLDQCANCRGEPLYPVEIDPALQEAAVTFLRRTYQVIVPRLKKAAGSLCSRRW